MRQQLNDSGPTRTPHAGRRTPDAGRRAADYGASGGRRWAWAEA